MDKYSIQQVSEKLGITKQTLRYYETLRLVLPERGKNNYRCYTQKDINDLLYIQLMKYAGFSLEETGKVLYNKRNVMAEKESMKSTMSILINKKASMEKTVAFLQGLIKLSDVFMDTLQGKKSVEDMDNLVQKIYEDVFAGEGGHG